MTAGGFLMSATLGGHPREKCRVPEGQKGQTPPSTPKREGCDPVPKSRHIFLELDPTGFSFGQPLNRTLSILPAIGCCLGTPTEPCPISVLHVLAIMHCESTFDPLHTA